MRWIEWCLHEHGEVGRLGQQLPQPVGGSGSGLNVQEEQRKQSAQTSRLCLESTSSAVCLGEDGWKQLQSFCSSLAQARPPHEQPSPAERNAIAPPIAQIHSQERASSLTSDPKPQRRKIFSCSVLAWMC